MKEKEMIINISELIGIVFGKGNSLCKIKCSPRNREDFRYTSSRDSWEAFRRVQIKDGMLLIGNKCIFSFYLGEEKYHIESSKDQYLLKGYFISQEKVNSKVDIGQLNISNNKKKLIKKTLKLYNNVELSQKDRFKIACELFTKLLKFTNLEFTNLHGFDGNYFKITEFNSYNQYTQNPEKRKRKIENLKNEVNNVVTEIWKLEKELKKLRDFKNKLNVKIDRQSKFI